MSQMNFCLLGPVLSLASAPCADASVASPPPKLLPWHDKHWERHIFGCPHNARFTHGERTILHQRSRGRKRRKGRHREENCSTVGSETLNHYFGAITK